MENVRILDGLVRSEESGESAEGNQIKALTAALKEQAAQI
jgi:hypothetical protein